LVRKQVAIEKKAFDAERIPEPSAYRDNLTNSPAA
jgi:hypothetical protein